MVDQAAYSDAGFSYWRTPAAVSLIASLQLLSPAHAQEEPQPARSMTTVITGDFLNAEIAASSSLAYTNEYDTSFHAPSMPSDATVFEKLLERVDYLNRKQHGWKGEESVPPSIATVSDARAFIRKLANEGITKAPSIGLDSDGDFVFFWREELLVLNLSIYGDGTYSFFAKVGDKSKTVDEATMSDPLDYFIKYALTS